jgi:YVTN family beta-propeller protein
VQTFAATPIQIVVSGPVTYVTTADPAGIIAVRDTGTTVAVLWSATLAEIPLSVIHLDDRVFVTQSIRGAVVALDAATGAVVGTAKIRGPVSLAPGIGAVIVAGHTDSTLIWLSAQSLATLRTERVDNPSALLRDGNDLLVTSTQESSVSIIDVETGRVRAHVNGVMANNAEAMTPDRVMVGTYGSAPTLRVFDRADLRPISTTSTRTEVFNIVPTAAGLVCDLAATQDISVLPNPA